MSVEFTEGYLQMLTEVNERGKANMSRLDQCERNIEELKEENKSIYKMTASIEKMCMSMDYIKDVVKENTEDIKAVKNEVSDIKSQPNKTKADVFDSVVKYICIAVGGGLLTYLLSSVLPEVFSK